MKEITDDILVGLGKWSNLGIMYLKLLVAEGNDISKYDADQMESAANWLVGELTQRGLIQNEGI